MPLDINAIRSQFPALAGDAVYFDNPGGTQVPQRVVAAMSDYLIKSNANRSGAFKTSETSDEILEIARQAMADFLNANQAEEIVFGPNMTSLTFTISRALARSFNTGDEIIVTHLDHDANISPWMQIAEDRGCQVRWLDFDVEDCTLMLSQLDDLLSSKTRLVAVGLASNAVGTINPVAHIARKAHDVGALCFVDAVQYAPHGVIDVQKLECDFLVVSAYKFFGPHIGALFGKHQLLSELTPYKVRPASNQPPGKFETGTQNHEGIAGALAALEYLAEIGERYGQEHVENFSPDLADQKKALEMGMTAIRAYELELSRALVSELESIPGLRIYGISETRELDRRVPTFAFNIEGYTPRSIAEELGKRGIYVWDGNYYALAVTQRLGVEDSGGMVRVGPVHYNTAGEIERFGRELREIVGAATTP
jgi:cysteine desulfurase family protein (TIGR01976 family)